MQAPVAYGELPNTPHDSKPADPRLAPASARPRPPAEREARVRQFQAPSSTIPIFLLTSQVGGLGLTLTAADRVIM